ncbi:MAG: oligosaccharide flippase family protein [Phycisphaerae bacterium]|nr:oligosaccharide flippase family protein [Phycisphaerae bacterium]
MTRSVLANWIGYVVVLVWGFVVPRLIDTYRGPVALGLWDFGWSLLVYIDLLSIGVVSAVNRYVARYRAVSDWGALNATVNSSLVLLSLSFLLGIVATVAFVLLVPWLLPDVSGAQVVTAQWVVTLLAASATLRLLFGVFNGVITGFERFDLLNVIRGGGDALVFVGSIILLVKGLGVAALAGLVLGMEVVTDVARYVVARRVCRSLRISPRLARREVVRELVGFGGKTVLQSMARSGLYQLNSILVAYFLGPATLAVYSRQRSLVLQGMRFLKQYSQVFIPTSSWLHARSDEKALRELLIDTSRYGFYISLPITALLVIMGGPLLDLWMGADYRAPLVLGVLALGHALSLPQQGVFSVLMGMGRHGLASLMELGGAVVGIGLGFLALGPLGWGMVGAAAAVAVPVSLVGGVLLPMYGCWLLGMPLGRYVKSVAVGPMLAIVPFAGCLLLARHLRPEAPLASLGIGVLSGGVVLAGVYWIWVVPMALRARILGMLGMGGRSGDASGPLRP